ncbi:MAG TPA: M15 family metallopeptidase [Chryseosolibacter sp.]
MKYFLTCCVIVVTTAFFTPAIAQDGESYLNTLLNTEAVFDTTAFVQMVDEVSIPTDSREDAWKQWQVVENFTYGKDRGNLPMIADLNSLHPYFRDRITELIEVCKKQGIELAVVESYRTHAKQAEYFGMGRKYTRSKGGNSKHQYGLAVDVVPIIDGKAVWENHTLWKKIGVNGERLGLRWGGRWRAPYDPAHFEWSGGITAMQLAKGLMPSIPRSYASLYPCLEDDIKKLQEYWEAWETEQSVLATTSARSIVKSAGSAGQKP